MVALITALSGAVATGQSSAAPPASEERAPQDFRDVVRAARAKVFPAVVYLRCLRQGLESGRARTEEVGGSGVIVSPGGEILTNWHVIDRATEVRCLLSDGRAFPARLVASDRDLDLALVQLEVPPDASTLPFAELGTSAELEEGDFVMAMGAPWGLNRSVSVGIVSCARRYLPDASEYSLWLQTDASISPGNSGGPLVDTRGRVVGITTLGRLEGGDMGFAIPADTIRLVLDRMRTRGEVGWAWTGILLQPLRDFDRNLWLPGERGTTIASVEPGSPAEEAGLRGRDRILTVAGEPTDGVTAEDLPAIRRRLALLVPGTPVDLLVERDDVGGPERHTFTLVPAIKGRVQGDELDAPRWGLSLKAINRFENPELHRLRKDGIFIFGVRSPGNGENARLVAGDILLAVDGTEIGSLADAKTAYERSLERLTTGPRFIVKVLRAGQQRQIVLDISRDFERE